MSNSRPSARISKRVRVALIAGASLILALGMGAAIADEGESLPSESISSVSD